MQLNKQLSKRDWLGFCGWLCVCFAVSALGAIASVEAKSFYAQLQQPAWAPPGWLFGPVWTTLFILMAIAAWLVWQRGGFKAQAMPLTSFLLQLLLNALWSWLFFAWHLGSLALLDILFLWLVISVTIALFWRVSRVAAMLLLPYLLWVSFAACLNYTVWQLNPTLLG